MMNKHILIAFDDSENAKRAVEFIGTHLSTECTVTLFSVVLNTESICSMQSPELTAYFLERQSSFCALEDKKRELLDTALVRARNQLIKFGFSPEQIRLKLNNVHKGVARDIIAEANHEAYDLIVLGKKGHAKIRDFFLGSISNKVLHGAHKSTVLLVD